MENEVNYLCYFTSDQPADGKPVSYSMHKTGGIAGGTGPGGSIRSSLIDLGIARSKKAQKLHNLGFVLKLIVLIVVVFELITEFVLPFDPWVRWMICFLIILNTGLLVRLIYALNKTLAKSMAKHHPDVIQKRKEGYKWGGHPMISTTPFGFIFYLFRWLL